MRITTIINGKGGVGKTTAAHALGTGLHRCKSSVPAKTLAIDYDPQGNLSYAYGADIINSPTMYHVINGDTTIDEAIQHTPQGDIIVGNPTLAKIESMFSGDDIFDGLYKLAEQLSAICGYTHILIDNQPLINGLLSRQALIAATDIVVPMSADTFTIQGLVRLEKAVESIKKRDNPKLFIAGILLTKYNPRTTVNVFAAQSIKGWTDSHDTKIYNAYIRESVKVKESQAKKQSLFDYAPDSNPALDYLAFISEYMEEEG